MLKTLGLTQVMAQSGLPILADKGSRVGIFEKSLLILEMSSLLSRACLPSLAHDQYCGYSWQGQPAFALALG